MLWEMNTMTGSKWPILENRDCLAKMLGRKMTYQEIADVIGGGCTRDAVVHWIRKHKLKSQLRRGTTLEPKAYWPGHE
jgi:hypothetical protein